MTTGVQLEQYFETILAGVGKTPVFWQEGITGLPANTIIKVWKDHPTLQSVIVAGLKNLYAGNYLDQQIPNPSQTCYEWEEHLRHHHRHPAAISWGEQVDSMNTDSPAPLSSSVGQPIRCSVSTTDVWPISTAIRIGVQRRESSSLSAQSVQRLHHRCPPVERRQVHRRSIGRLVFRPVQRPVGPVPPPPMRTVHRSNVHGRPAVRIAGVDEMRMLASG